MDPLWVMTTELGKTRCVRIRPCANSYSSCSGGLGQRMDIGPSRLASGVTEVRKHMLRTDAPVRPGAICPTHGPIPPLDDYCGTQQARHHPGSTGKTQFQWLTSLRHCSPDVGAMTGGGGGWEGGD